MLPSLLGGYYLAAYHHRPPFLPPATAAAPRSSARLAAAFPARLRYASRIVARRRAAGAGEAVSASAAAEGDDEDEAELQDEGFPRWEGGGGEEEDYDHDPEIGDIQEGPDPHGGEDKEEAPQDRAGQDRVAQPHEGRLQQALHSWHIVGRLGGCNSMNMQLSQLPLDCKRPMYDALEGANITPTSFYNFGDLEIQDNLARLWVDIGIHEPLLLDILLNALTTISSDHVGIKQVQFGGLEFVNWNDDLKTEEVGYSVHKI